MTEEPVLALRYRAWRAAVPPEEVCHGMSVWLRKQFNRYYGAEYEAYARKAGQVHLRSLPALVLDFDEWLGHELARSGAEFDAWLVSEFLQGDRNDAVDEQDRKIRQMMADAREYGEACFLCHSCSFLVAHMDPLSTIIMTTDPMQPCGLCRAENSRWEYRADSDNVPHSTT